MTIAYVHEIIPFTDQVDFDFRSLKYVVAQYEIHECSMKVNININENHDFFTGRANKYDAV